MLNAFLQLGMEHRKWSQQVCMSTNVGCANFYQLFDTHTESQRQLALLGVDSALAEKGLQQALVA